VFPTSVSGAVILGADLSRRLRCVLRRHKDFSSLRSTVCRNSAVLLPVAAATVFQQTPGLSVLCGRKQNAFLLASAQRESWDGPQLSRHEVTCALVILCSSACRQRSDCGPRRECSRSQRASATPPSPTSRRVRCSAAIWRGGWRAASTTPRLRQPTTGRRWGAI